MDGPVDLIPVLPFSSSFHLILFAAFFFVFWGIWKSLGAVDGAPAILTIQFHQKP